MATNNTFMTAKKEAIRTFKGGSIKNGVAGDTVISEMPGDMTDAAAADHSPEDLVNMDYNEITVTA